MKKTYSILNNVSNSILKLNDYCSRFGFKIVFYDLSEFEKKFGSLFGIKQNYSGQEICINSKKSGPVNVTLEFWERIKKHQKFNIFSLQDQGGIYILVNTQQKEDIDLEKFANFKDFTIHFISTLRLFKKGDVNSNMFFQKTETEYQIPIVGSFYSGNYYSENLYHLDSSDISNLNKLLELRLVKNELSDIAFTYFMNCYSTKDNEVRFINCMIAFESIFNRGRDQIRHIVSRHTALIIASDYEEFKLIYSDMKKLYDIRSSIMHNGSASKKSYKHFGKFKDATELIMSYLRKVIIFCLKYNEDKDTLFESLNYMGIKENTEVIKAKR